RALTIAALARSMPPSRRDQALAELRGHLGRLAEWTGACQETFADKYALVGAEIARLEGRELEAERLYEDAIGSARKHGFVQDEAISHEAAARFHADRGFATIAQAYLRNARSCYARWGASAKVEQLERDHADLREDTLFSRLGITIGVPVEQIDVATVVKASHVILGEIVLDRLLKAFLTMGLEHAGAERGVFMRLRGNDLLIEAEASIAGGQIEVLLRQAPPAPDELPSAVLHTVARTRESVILDDAAHASQFTEDPYIAARKPRSVLCLP